MNESLEAELKSLSISELNDLYDYLKSKKNSIFRTMKYDKTLFIESNIIITIATTPISKDTFCFIMFEVTF